MNRFSEKIKSVNFESKMVRFGQNENIFQNMGSVIF